MHRKSSILFLTDVHEWRGLIYLVSVTQGCELNYTLFFLLALYDQPCKIAETYRSAIVFWSHPDSWPLLIPSMLCVLHVSPFFVWPSFMGFSRVTCMELQPIPMRCVHIGVISPIPPIPVCLFSSISARFLNIWPLIHHSLCGNLSFITGFPALVQLSGRASHSPEVICYHLFPEWSLSSLRSGLRIVEVGIFVS